MGGGASQVTASVSLFPTSERLDSWKEIAAYLRRDIRTVQRWEKREGLPVHRHLHEKLGSVYAYRAELDNWWNSRPALHAGPTARKLMLAVLPFDNLSPEPDQDYFSDGLTEEMITQLGRLYPHGLGVVARTSAMRYKGSEKTLPQIGRELGVDCVLQGSVRRAAGRVRIAAQLIQVSDQTTLWAESYERDLADVFAIQSEVARQIAHSLTLEWLPSRHAALTRPPTTSLAAYEAYLRGRYFWNKRTEQGFHRALKYFEQALASDSRYALAYAGLAECYSLLPFYSLQPPADAMPRAREAATRALALDETRGEPHTSLGEVKAFFEWDWAGAEREYRRALELNPSYATGHHWFASFLSVCRRSEEALAEIELAQELDPLSLIINVWAGFILYHARRYDQAIGQFQRTLELDPDFPIAHTLLGLAYEQKAMLPEAVEELRRSRVLNGEDPTALALLGHTYARAGQPERARQVLAELQQLSLRRYVTPYHVAAIYTGLGEHAAAFERLEHAYQERSTWLSVLNVDPRFDPLRPEPHFQELLHRIGLAA